ncbi:MAG: UDP-N-acetylenolpyruvoylglucosamine reductase [Nitrospinae bacterium RIFCSPLOWO2_12_39_16]|nr:MAG: UDP-N-acetylenolpyruvoylglucosamine reductase [Nitrospinae bacterium RIFCSPLOWO2_12_39_16]HLA47799.1 UDP-N-acetylmuramate dehydrogenase [Nitrospinota bacterium]
MKTERLKIIFKDVRGEKKFNELMRNYTSFRIGGDADLLIFPENIDDLKNVLCICHDKKIPLFILGFGTNLLIKDGGIRGVVVSLNEGFNYISDLGFLISDFKFQIQNPKFKIIRAGAGAGLQVLVNFALKNELAGMEFAVGIPGSVGGAVIMNAGIRDGEMKDIVKSVKIMTDDGETKVLKNEDIGFSYRNSDFPEGSVVLETDIVLKNGNSRDIKKMMKLLIADRKSKQPLSSYCAGSVFKNPPNDFAGRLIELAGLKAFSIGDAAVSEVHSNFIVNRGKAAASDVLRLIEIIKERVFTKTGISLEEEIKIVGED